MTTASKSSRDRGAELRLVGSKRLPLHRVTVPTHRGEDVTILCSDQAGRIPHEVGEYVRVCHTCGTTFVATVTEAEWATTHCGRPTLIVHWHVA